MKSTIDLLGRRWTLRIIWELGTGPAGFRELQRRCGNMSSSVLSARLTELAAAHLVAGEAGHYRLTELGHELVLALAPLQVWDAKWTLARQPVQAVQAVQPAQPVQPGSSSVTS